MTPPTTRLSTSPTTSSTAPDTRAATAASTSTSMRVAATLPSEFTVPSTLSTSYAPIAEAGTALPVALTTAVAPVRMTLRRIPWGVNNSSMPPDRPSTVPQRVEGASTNRAGNDRTEAAVITTFNPNTEASGLTAPHTVAGAPVRIAESVAKVPPDSAITVAETTCTTCVPAAGWLRPPAWHSNVATRPRPAIANEKDRAPESTRAAMPDARNHPHPVGSGESEAGLEAAPVGLPGSRATIASEIGRSRRDARAPIPDARTGQSREMFVVSPSARWRARERRRPGRSPRDRHRLPGAGPPDRPGRGLEEGDKVSAVAVAEVDGFQAAEPAQRPATEGVPFGKNRRDKHGEAHPGLEGGRAHRTRLGGEHLEDPGPARQPKLEVGLGKVQAEADAGEVGAQDDTAGWIPLFAAQHDPGRALPPQLAPHALADRIEGDHIRLPPDHILDAQG